MTTFFIARDYPARGPTRRLQPSRTRCWRQASAPRAAASSASAHSPSVGIGATVAGAGGTLAELAQGGAVLPGAHTPRPGGVALAVLTTTAPGVALTVPVKV